MARKPEPIEIVRAKLDSTDEKTLVAALEHAAAHRLGGRDLALNVLNLFEDPNPLVQQHAYQTFQAIGAGASECVPLLLAMAARSAPNRPFNRLAVSLGAIGPSAVEALPMLRERYRVDPDNAHVLMAILKIAADDRETIDIFLDQAFSPDFGTSMGGLMYIERLSRLGLDLAFDRIRLGIDSTDAAIRTAASRVLARLAAKRPEAAIAPITALLGSPPDREEVFDALNALMSLPLPVPSALVEGVIRVIESGKGMTRMRALDALGRVGAGATRAQPVLLGLIRSNVRSVPVSGERGWPAGELAAAALALARHYPSKDAVDPLLAWLSAMPDARPQGREWVSFRSAGDVAKALAMLDPTSAAVQFAILAAIASSRSALGSPNAGVVDFERRVREALSFFPNADDLFRRAEALGMARVDPFAEADMPVEDVPEPLPDLSTTADASGSLSADPRATPRTFLIDDQMRPVLDRMVRHGSELLEVTVNAEPIEVAAATNAWLTRVKYSSLLLPPETGQAIGAAFGEALRRQLGWDWRLFHGGEDVTLALASPDDAFVHLPLAFISRQLEPRRSPTALLLFNMLAQGQIPPSKAGAFTEIG
ncbi:MAG: hypothetical protein KIT43_04060 [Bauldia sp.]|nr:hypothetical protein [Bauldia sp.]MCW5717854.1 hypothetical protein [Bauldia sp.]